MATIPTTIVEITTANSLALHNNTAFTARDLLRRSYTSDATGFESKFFTCTCGTIHKESRCPACGSVQIKNKQYMSSLLTKINAVRDWLNTKIDAATTYLSDMSTPIAVAA